MTSFFFYCIFVFFQMKFSCCEIDGKHRSFNCFWTCIWWLSRSFLLLDLKLSTNRLSHALIVCWFFISSCFLFGLFLHWVFLGSFGFLSSLYQQMMCGNFSKMWISFLLPGWWLNWIIGSLERESALGKRNSIWPDSWPLYSAFLKFMSMIRD